MPLDKLRYFKTAAEERSLTRAAQKLGVSQQALSSAVAKLEEHYRARFFERRRTGLVLTPEGQHFYNYATAMLKREVRLSDELNEIRLRYTGVIRLGTTMTRSMTSCCATIQPRRKPGTKVLEKVPTMITRSGAIEYIEGRVSPSKRMFL